LTDSGSVAARKSEELVDRRLVLDVRAVLAGEHTAVPRDQEVRR
jgi:hypothetical protein